MRLKRRHFLCVFCALGAAVVPVREKSASLIAEARVEWKAGLATVNITPKQLIWMAGYAARKKPAEGVAQDLRAKALALEDRRGNRAVIITSDILGFPRSITEPVAERIMKQHGLRRGQVLLTSSHTHSGPVIRDSLALMYALDADQVAAIRAYTAKLQDQLVELAGSAFANLAPAQLSFGRGRAGFAINRRALKDGRMVISVNPAGPVNHEVPVLRVTSPDGKLRAALFSYACHNTTLTQDNYQYHGDYAGVAQEELEKAHPGAMALFMMGCGGDANPNPRNTMELARTHGEALAQAIDKVLQGSLRPLRGPVRCAFERVDLPFGPPPSRDELQKKLNDKDLYVQRHAKAMLDTLDRVGKLPADYPYPIQVLQLGKDLTLVALAGEVVVDYDIRLKREIGPPEKLWVAAYANDVFAYIASKRVIQEGGYEASNSMIYYGQPGPWAPEAEDVLVGKVRQMVRNLR